MTRDWARKISDLFADHYAYGGVAQETRAKNANPDEAGIAESASFKGHGPASADQPCQVMPKRVCHQHIEGMLGHPEAFDKITIDESGGTARIFAGAQKTETMRRVRYGCAK